VLQTIILANCCATNDFLFAARIKDPELAAACTAAISASRNAIRAVCLSTM